MYRSDFLQQALPNITVYVFESLDSTSQFLKLKSSEALMPSVCIAENQTNGYGQRGSKWYSNADSITFSVLLPINESINNLTGISQLVALDIKRTLASFTQEQIKLKWPNDLFVNDAKVGGLLIEVVKQSANQTWLVIGVGINIGVFNGKTPTSYKAAGIHFDNDLRNNVLINLCSRLVTLCESFHPKLWLDNSADWYESDIFRLNEEICLLRDNKQERFYYAGLSASAELMLSDIPLDSLDIKNENILFFSSGAVSVRRLEWLS